MGKLTFAAVCDIWNGIPRCAADALTCDQDSIPKIKHVTLMVTNITQCAFVFVGGIAVIFLVYGGFQYITSAGNPDMIGKAKSTLLYAVLGLILTILSYAVIGFVVNILKGVA